MHIEHFISDVTTKCIRSDIRAFGNEDGIALSILVVPHRIAEADSELVV